MLHVEAEAVVRLHDAVAEYVAVTKRPPDCQSPRAAIHTEQLTASRFVVIVEIDGETVVDVSSTTAGGAHRQGLLAFAAWAADQESYLAKALQGSLADSGCVR